MEWNVLWLLLFGLLMAVCCWAMMRMMMGPRQRDQKDHDQDDRKE